MKTPLLARLGKRDSRVGRGFGRKNCSFAFCPFFNLQYELRLNGGGRARAGGLISPSGGGESELLSVHFLCGGGGGAGAAWHESHAV